jgi:hypothetical protein
MEHKLGELYLGHIYEGTIRINEGKQFNRGFCHVPLNDELSTKEAYEQRNKDIELIVAAVNSCIDINPSNPLAVAQGIKDMYIAANIAKDLVDTVLYEHPDDDIAQEQKRLVDKALAKVTEVK